MQGFGFYGVALGLAAVLAAVPTLTMADVYKWTDSDGNVHYTDEPREDAERLDVPPAQVYESPSGAETNRERARDERARGDGAQQTQQQNAGYSEFAIAAPSQEEHIRGGQQTITVRLNIAPKLQKGHKVRITMDGETVASGRSTSYTVEPVYRGTHMLNAQIRDGNGRVVKQASTVTFYKHQPSVN